MQNILQIENLLDLVEYALKDSLEKEFLVWNSTSTINIPINNSLLKNLLIFCISYKLDFSRSNHSQSRVV